MIFCSVLSRRTDAGFSKETPEAPDFFVDLNLDQIIDAITVGKDEYNLKPFFHTSLNDVDEILYRQEVMRDLENRPINEAIETFAQKMQTMRQHIALENKLHYARQKERWFLDAVEIYCDAVQSLARDISVLEVKSRGLVSFCTYLAGYAASEGFSSLLAQTKKLQADLPSVQYCTLVSAGRVRVRKYESEIDYSAEVERTFEKFNQGAVKDYLTKFRNGSDMNHVEAQVLDLVARLHPEIFQDLDDYCARNAGYLDETVAAFDREVQFYISYLDFIAGVKRVGLQFCYPSVSDIRKEVSCSEGFDLALARKLAAEDSSPVCNDFCLNGRERIFIVSGPNQGGKTTFARAFGQMHYLASLGCPVQGREVRLLLFDKLFTHFEKEEDIRNLRGKLEDDLVRIHRILREATSNSVIIMNEIFNSTTLKDAIFLGKKVMERIIQLDLVCICVTFIDELSTMSDKTVSMVSTVDPGNPAVRTYKVVRKRADGLSYAISLAEKYRLTYDFLRERILS
ncbi:MAG: DNA mismatch repair protein MutS [Spirochaetia bacterium]|jgi:DNA mismatch repair ATPase MutS